MGKTRRERVATLTQNRPIQAHEGVLSLSRRMASLPFPSGLEISWKTRPSRSPST